jgi:hypothetical protein
MRARSRYVVLLAAAALLAAGACSESDEPVSAPDALTGEVVSVHPEEGSVERFELETGGERTTILIDAQLDYGFDLAHLREHMETGDPVRVDLELRVGDLYATQIDDA